MNMLLITSKITLVTGWIVEPFSEIPPAICQSVLPFPAPSVKVPEIGLTGDHSKKPRATSVPLVATNSTRAWPAQREAFGFFS